jgi:hypothetical protein
VSLLSGLAFLFAAASVLQFADILVSNPGPWTQTWVALVITLIGLGLARTWRSAVVGLLTLIGLTVFVFSLTQAIFDYHGLATYRYIALILAVLFGLAAMGVGEWPRLSSVLGVAAGLLLILIAASLLVGALSSVAGAVTNPGSGSLNNAAKSVGAVGSGWKIVVAAGGLALATAAAIRRDPGIGWASAGVLALFVTVTGTSTSSPSLIFWPLLFLVFGLLIIASGLVGASRGTGPATVGLPTDSAGGFVLARNAETFAAGLLALGIGVAMTEGRMAGTWSDAVLLVVIAVPAAFALACAFAQPPGGFSPPWATSLLAILALLLTAGTLERLAGVIVDRSVNDLAPATITWVTGVAALVGLALVRRYRSAGLVLVAYVLGAVALLAGIDWIFGPDLKPRTYEYVLVGLAIVYVAVGLVVTAWPRLEAVSGVAAGIAVTLALVLVVIVFVLDFVFSSLGGPAGGSSGSKAADGWQIVALVATFVVAGIAARRREAGPAYAAGLLAIAFVVVDAVRNAGESGSLVIWPIVLLVGGAVIAAGGIVGGGAGPPAPDSPATSATSA